MLEKEIAMKLSEYDRLRDHYVKAEQLLKHISSLRHLIQGAETRVLEGTMSFHLYVRTKALFPRRTGKYDHGVVAELPVEILQGAVLPALKVELDRCLLEFKNLPSMPTKKE
jgi:hypothetical protein